MVMAAGLLTACDPAKDDVSVPGSSLTSQQLQDGFSFTQYGDEEYTTEAPDGNYFTFFTSPSRVVSIYQLDDEGNKSVLVSGVANGKFKIVPKRGNSTEQKFYVETLNFDGSTVVAERTANVYVPSDLTPEMRLLASDAYGKKIWKWDTEWREDGGAWGNVGYAAGSGADFALNGNGACWFGCAPADLVGQLEHSDTGVATGEEDPNAYMEFYDDGNIITYDGGGNQIRKGKYSVEGYTGERNHPSIDGGQQEWSLGTLKTTAGSILFPFQINYNKEHHDGVRCPTNFEIMQLDANHLKLIYVSPGTGSWKEATWWAFKSESDPESALNNFDKKAWTWDTEWRDDHGAWGNVGYAAGSGADFALNGNGACWFGCAPADLVGQLEHSDTGVATGEEDPNAYMIFDWKTNAITSYDASGKQIRQGKYSITDWGMGKRTIASVDGGQQEWALGKIHIDAGAILFPFQINYNKDHHDGVRCPTDFEIMQLDADHLKLIYVSPGTGSWKEATWWAFKAKK